MNEPEMKLSKPILGWGTFERAQNSLLRKNLQFTRENLLKEMTYHQDRSIVSQDSREFLMKLPQELWTEDDRHFVEGNWELMSQKIMTEKDYDLGIWD